MTQEPRTQPLQKQQFNVYLPPDLVKRLKHHAIEQGDSLSRLVEQVFRDYLDRAEEGDK